MKDIKGMRRFTQNDWYAYMGAEMFEDDTAPMIYEYGPLTLIASKGGIEVGVVKDSDEYDSDYYTEGCDGEYMNDLCERIIRETKGMTRAEMNRYFKGLGL